MFNSIERGRFGGWEHLDTVPSYEAIRLCGQRKEADTSRHGAGTRLIHSRPLKEPRIG